MKNTGIILLAAGNSTRMGSPKQLLLYQGKTLLERIVDTSLQVFDNNKIILVLGANHSEIAFQIKDKITLISVNEEWESGMASSIKAGLQTLLKHFPDMQRCIISVCDQPYLSNEVFIEMLKLADYSSKEIIAAKYAGTIGVPALFSKKYFKKLLHLSCEQGAKKIIQQNMDDVNIFIFDEGAIDIDTPSDYENLKTKE